jgi:pimeloyl-ACP methyl ester carboxylesterase
VSTEPSETVELAHIGAEAENVGSVYVHGTGFCKEVWFPVVRSVDMAMDAEDTSAMLLDQRGHGDSTPFTGPLLWDLVAKDVAAALDDVPHPIVGVGHSGGGAAIARTEILSPGTFSMMILIEPIVKLPDSGSRRGPSQPGMTRFSTSMLTMRFMRRMEVWPSSVSPRLKPKPTARERTSIRGTV